MYWINDILGTVFYSITVFMTGALLGKPLWCWMCKRCSFMRGECNKGK